MFVAKAVPFAFLLQTNKRQIIVIIADPELLPAIDTVKFLPERLIRKIIKKRRRASGYVAKPKKEKVKKVKKAKASKKVEIEEIDEDSPYND